MLVLLMFTYKYFPKNYWYSMKQFNYIVINELNQNKLKGFFDHQIQIFSRHNIHLYNNIILTGHVSSTFNVPNITKYL